MPRWLQLGAAEEVAAADDDGDLDAVDRRGDLAGHLADDVGVHAELSPAERLARQLQEDAAAPGGLTDHDDPLVDDKLSKGMRKGPHRIPMRAFSPCYAPTLKRAKPVRVSPAFLATCATDSLLSFA